MISDELGNILDPIASDNDAEADIVALRQLLSSSDRQSLLQLGKYGVNVGQGQDIQIGDSEALLRSADRNYQGVDAQAIREISGLSLRNFNPLLNLLSLKGFFF
jgi:hypothetical protein